MKIISACLSNFYLEGMNYQENVLPRVWKRQGHEVMIVTAGFYQDDKNISHIDGNKKCTYKNDDGIEVNILPYASCCVRRLQKVMYTFAGLREILVKFHPDVIFFHGLGSGNIADAVWYKRKIEQNALLILDNHSMKENMAPVMNTKSIKGFAIRSLYRMVNRKYQRYYDAVYNITPDCLKFAYEYYKIPRKLLKPTTLGFDDELIKQVDIKKAREAILGKYGFSDSTILIVHGGKMVKNKRTIELINAVRGLCDKRVKLIIFGSIPDSNRELRDTIEMNNSIVKYYGMLTAIEYYRLFLGADLAVFPASQSSLWQEAIGCGLPAILGTGHVDMAGSSDLSYLDRGGNCLFIDDPTVEEISGAVQSVLAGDKLLIMKEAAQRKAKPYFSYENIARRLLEV